MMATILMVVSAGILLLLGTVHLLYTFFGPRLRPRDPELLERMRAVSPVITRQTTMWRAWIGFNASHSMGAMLFGLIYGFLALQHSALLFASHYLLGLGLLTLLAYLLLAIRYWFIIPLTGIGLATLCFVASIFLSRS